MNELNSDNPQDKLYLPADFAAPDGQILKAFPEGLVLCRHQKPNWNDSMLSKPEWDKVFGGDRFADLSEHKSDLLMDFSVPGNGGLEPFPAGTVPCHHEEPTLNDIALPELDWDRTFGGDLKLTDVKKGLRSQKVNQNITQIADAICNRYEFITVSGQLAIYEPPCWKILNHGEMLRYVKDVIEELFPEDAKYLNLRQREEIAYLLLDDRKTKHLREIPAPDHRYLCCRDYMYDWHTGTCYEHNSSFQCFFYLNIDAKTIGACDSTHWEMFLNNITSGNRSLRQRILEMIGVILAGYPSKSFFFLEGESNTGKSQLVNVLRRILGKTACVALNHVSQLGEKWTTGSLFGKLLCLCGDMPDAPLDNRSISAIKQLTGDDLIRAEVKYKDPFMFENTAKLLFVSNYPLRIPNQSQEQALLERLVYIPCKNPVRREDQIPALHKILYEEAGYIVDLAMEALRELESRNGVFTPLPDDFSAGLVRLPDREQLVKDFIREHYLLEEDASCRVSEVFQAFCVYAPETEMDSAQFSKLLYRLYPQIRQARRKDAREYKGLRPAGPVSENPA